MIDTSIGSNPAFEKRNTGDVFGGKRSLPALSLSSVSFNFKMQGKEKKDFPTASARQI
jgi:hypothetical protein